MHAMQTGTRGHYCPECSKWYPGNLKRRNILCCDHAAGTDIDDVCIDPQWGCRDPAGPCWLGDEDEFDFVNELWQCGDCETYYGNVGEAISCCG